MKSILVLKNWLGLPGRPAGKESACNARDPSSIPGLGKSPGEGIGYPLQYSWASLVALTEKNPPAMWETWVRSLGWEDPLEKGTAVHFSILAWRIPWTEEPGRLPLVGVAKVYVNLNVYKIILHCHQSFYISVVKWLT